MNPQLGTLELVGFGPGGWGWQLLAGTLVTLQIAAASYGLGVLLGLCGAWAKLSGPWFARGVGSGYTALVRGVPEILVIFLIYYGGTSGIRALIGLVVPGVSIEIDAFAAAVVALGFIAGAYSTEIFRGALLAVDKGQHEAARALSLHPLQAFFLIVLPQALRVALPPLGNLWLVVLKDSALISVVGIRDLVGVGATAALSTRKPFTFYMTVALIFLAISILSAIVLHLLERRFSRGFRHH